MKVLSGFCVAAMVAAIFLHGDARISVGTRRDATLDRAAPAAIAWAWEEPEDLRGIDPERVGVAFLAERVFLGQAAQVIPRHQRIQVPPSAFAVAVARLETAPNFRDSSALREEAAAAVLEMAALPGIQGLQVDFDASVSQREFYADVLRNVRAKLPRGTGLTITALVSWCSSENGWLSRLPVDAAVPMYFRLGKHAGGWPVREPLCRGNAGISTDEPRRAPKLDEATRIYLFSPRPWSREQLATLSRSGLPAYAREAQ